MNKLTSLPTEIGQLVGLKKLVCSENQLTSLPAAIGQLAELRTLECKNNRLTSLPAEIGQLRKLQFLHYDGNQLSALPQELSHLDLDLDFQRSRVSSQESDSSSEENNINSQENNSNSEGDGKRTLRDFCLMSAQGGGNNLSSQESDSEEDVPGVLNALITLSNLSGLSIPGVLAVLNTPSSSNSEEGDLSFQGSDLSSDEESSDSSNMPDLVASFQSFQRLVSQERSDLKNLQIPTLQQSESWPNVSLWLSKLMDSADFENSNTCSLTVERVLSILKLAEENEGYRNSLSAILTQALETCVDRATLPLCPLETQKAIIEAKAGSVGQMLQVLKGAFASEILDKYALLFVQNHPSAAVQGEALEVHLAFQLKLKKEFNLPIGITKMNYGFCARLKVADIEKAKAHVHQELKNQENFIAFVIQQDAWAEKLSADFAAEKTAALAPMHAASEQLDDELFAGTLSEQQYKDRIEGLKTKFNQATQAWLKAKTQAICLGLAGAAAPVETIITIQCKELPYSKNLFIRGDTAGLNWDKGIKLTRIDWDTFQVKLCTPFQGVLKYKLLIDDVLWEGGNNQEIRPGQKVERVHTFEKNSLPKATKTVLKLEYAVPAGKTLFVLGDGPLGNWDRKVPMLPVQGKKNSWFIAFEGNFADFKYKLRLGDAWEQGENRTARCGQIIAMKSIRF